MSDLAAALRAVPVHEHGDSCMTWSSRSQHTELTCEKAEGPDYEALAAAARAHLGGSGSPSPEARDAGAWADAVREAYGLLLYAPPTTCLACLSGERNCDQMPTCLTRGDSYDRALGILAALASVAPAPSPARVAPETGDAGAPSKPKRSCNVHADCDNPADPKMRCCRNDECEECFGN